MIYKGVAFTLKYFLPILDICLPSPTPKVMQPFKSISELTMCCLLLFHALPRLGTT